MSANKLATNSKSKSALANPAKPTKPTILSPREINRLVLERQHFSAAEKNAKADKDKINKVLFTQLSLRDEGASFTTESSELKVGKVWLTKLVDQSKETIVKEKLIEALNANGINGEKIAKIMAYEGVVKVSNSTYVDVRMVNADGKED